MGPKSRAHDGPMAELACSQCLLQPCWLSCASAGDSTGGVVAQIISILTTTCRSRCVLAEPVSFKTQHIRAKPGRRCVGRPASEAPPGGHTPRPRLSTDVLTHPARRISFPRSLPTQVCRRTETAKRSLLKTTALFSPFSSLKLFGTFRVGVFRPQGFLHLCAFGFRDSLPALPADSSRRTRAARRLVPLREPRAQARSSEGLCITDRLVPPCRRETDRDLSPHI